MLKIVNKNVSRTLHVGHDDLVILQHCNSITVYSIICHLFCSEDSCSHGECSYSRLQCLIRKGPLASAGRSLGSQSLHPSGVRSSQWK